MDYICSFLTASASRIARLRGLIVFRDDPTGIYAVVCAILAVHWGLDTRRRYRLFVASRHATLCSMFASIRHRSCCVVRYELLVQAAQRKLGSPATRDIKAPSMDALVGGSNKQLVVIEVVTLTCMKVDEGRATNRQPCDVVRIRLDLRRIGLLHPSMLSFVFHSAPREVRRTTPMPL